MHHCPIGRTPSLGCMTGPAEEPLEGRRRGPTEEPPGDLFEGRRGTSAGGPFNTLYGRGWRGCGGPGKIVHQLTFQNGKENIDYIIFYSFIIFLTLGFLVISIRSGVLVHILTHIFC